MKKILLASIGLIVLTPLLTQARMQESYPIYGYNSTDHICQVKQGSENSEIREELEGQYWDLRDCRSHNPEIILFTGLGIIIWALLFALILLKNFYVVPHFQKKKLTILEKKVGALWDSLLISVPLFVLILLLHYFDIPLATYNYSSDIDHIIYSILIDSQIPFVFLIIYVIASSFVIFKNRNRVKG